MNDKTDLMNVDEALAKEVAGIQERIQRPTANVIRTTEKRFTLPDGSSFEGPMDVVIVDFINQNLFYEGRFDARNPTPPVCFAIDKVLSNMAPKASSPKAQATDCKDCPMNEFGSAGEGKACKNTILLAVLPPDASPEEPIMTLRVSPTGLKRFNSYVSTVSKLFSAPPIKVLTEVSFDPDRTYPSLIFRNPRANPKYAEHFGRRSEAEDLLTIEPNIDTDTKPAAATTTAPAAKAGTRAQVRRERA